MTEECDAARYWWQKERPCGEVSWQKERPCDGSAKGDKNETADLFR